MESKDTVIVHGEFDPIKVYQALADIIGERNGMVITVTGVKKVETKEGAG